MDINRDAAALRVSSAIMERTQMLAARTKTLNLAALLLAGAVLSACGSTAMHPRLSNRMTDAEVATGSSQNGKVPNGQGGVYKVGKPYQVAGIWYVPKEEPNYDATGVASWYGQDFHAKATANGEVFDMNAVSAAHTTLPMPSMVEVTNLENGRKIMVRVNDRGPFVGGRLIDLSYEAARQLGYERKGLANVRVRYVGPAPMGVGDGMRYASASSSPTAAAPIAVAAAPIAARPLPPPSPVSSQALAPVAAPRPTQYASSQYAAAPANYAPTARPDYRAPATSYPPSYSVASSSTYRVQAAAFSDASRAQQAVSQLAGTGQARVESVERDGGVIYRVIVQASNDEGEAWALRDRVAAVGFTDARVLRPF